MGERQLRRARGEQHGDDLLDQPKGMRANVRLLELDRSPSVLKEPVEFLQRGLEKHSCARVRGVLQLRPVPRAGVVVASLAQRVPAGAALFDSPAGKLAL